MRRADANEAARVESTARLAAFMEAEQERVIDLLLAREFGL
ncbi:hypothetical protein [Methylobacterium oryzisoli]